MSRVLTQRVGWDSRKTRDGGGRRDAGPDAAVGRRRTYVLPERTVAIPPGSCARSPTGPDRARRKLQDRAANGPFGPQRTTGDPAFLNANGSPMILRPVNG